MVARAPEVGRLPGWGLLSSGLYIFLYSYSILHGLPDMRAQEHVFVLLYPLWIARRFGGAVGSERWTKITKTSNRAPATKPLARLSNLSKKEGWVWVSGCAGRGE